MKFHYKILDVNENASQAEIRKKYRSLSLKKHPDKIFDFSKLSEDKKQEINDEFSEISEAYEILSDENKRKEYDRKLRVHSNIEENNKCSFSEPSHFSDPFDKSKPFKSSFNDPFFFNFVGSQFHNPYFQRDFWTSKNIDSLFSVLILLIIVIKKTISVIWYLIKVAMKINRYFFNLIKHPIWSFISPILIISFYSWFFKFLFRNLKVRNLLWELLQFIKKLFHNAS